MESDRLRALLFDIDLLNNPAESIWKACNCEQNRLNGIMEWGEKIG